MITKILENLSVPKNRILYIHSSMGWLSKMDISVNDARTELIEWVEGYGGTLAFPGFPFRGSHEEYLQKNSVFNIRKSPVRVGLLNETFRRKKGVLRSLDPDLNMLAYGEQADELIGKKMTGIDPMGPDSPFQRAIDLEGCLLGLGVSFNYMNMIHVLDARYREHYSHKIYSDKIYDVSVCDYDGSMHYTQKFAMLDQLQEHIKPSCVITDLNPSRDTLRSEVVGDTNFYMWSLPEWHQLCENHLEQQISNGQPPCWLKEAINYLPLSSK